ncbi:hypothetical protein [Pedobacter arcticus]|uniref:hypothetical protein n=1 Tax=Pedobacter arcticus TaxID=752140 RepID=UPI0002D6D6BB|nr:hypothetical protein [Pedobacter arcticus]
MRYLFIFSILCGYATIASAQTTGFSTQNLGNILNASGYELSLLEAKESTKGARFFLSKWLKGTVTAIDGTLVKNDSVLYYFDKISYNLYYTYDHKRTMKVENKNIRSFILQDGNINHSFKRMELIKPIVFFETLVENTTKYSLYKETATEYKKADYMNHGMYESGNRFDQYIDNFRYYIVLPGEKAYKPISFKKKSLEEVFDGSDAIFNPYFSKHKREPIDEDFLISLVNHLNTGS